MLTNRPNNNLLDTLSFGNAYLRTHRQRKMAECYSVLKTISQPETISTTDIGDFTFPSRTRVVKVPSYASQPTIPIPDTIDHVDSIFITDILLSNNTIKESYDDVGLANITKLLKTALQAKQTLQDSQAIGPTLLKNLQAYEKSKKLPAYFQEEMLDFSQLFLDGVKILDFLVGFDWISGILKDLKHVFTEQANAANNAYLQAEALLKSSQEVEKAIQKVEAHEPTKHQFSDSLRYIDQVAVGAAGLANTLRRGLALDAKLNNQFSDRLTAFKNQINTTAEAVLKQMKDLHEGVKSAIYQAGILNNYLATYASKFTKLGVASALVSEHAIPSLSKGVQICNTIASILDPLSCILKNMEFTAKNSVVSSAVLEISTFKNAMREIINQQSSAITHAFGFIENKLVPIHKIVSTTQDIKNYINTQASSFNNAISGLSSSFETIKSEMKPTKTFDCEKTLSLIDGKTLKIANFFVDADFKKSVTQLINEMNNVAIKAGFSTNLGNTSA